MFHKKKQAGDSAGGNLSIVTAVHLRNQGIPLPAALVLVSPWVALSSTKPAYHTNESYDLLHESFLVRGRELYLRGREDTQETSPINADVRGLPPTLVI